MASRCTQVIARHATDRRQRTRTGGIRLKSQPRFDHADAETTTESFRTRMSCRFCSLAPRCHAHGSATMPVWGPILGNMNRSNLPGQAAQNQQSDSLSGDAFSNGKRAGGTASGKGADDEGKETKSGKGSEGASDKGNGKRFSPRAWKRTAGRQGCCRARSEARGETRLEANSVFDG